jgi:O-antigen ligase
MRDDFGSVNRRPEMTASAHAGTAAVVNICDAVFGGLLALIYVTSRTVALQARQIGLVVLMGLVIGTAAFNRGFSLLSLGPIYITELCLAILAITTLVEMVQGQVRVFPAERTAKFVLLTAFAYLFWGGVRLLPDLVGNATLATIRNFALVYYAAFCILAWTAIQKADVGRVIEITLASIVVLSTITNIVTVALFYVQEGVTDDPNLKVIQGQAAVFALLSVVILVCLIRFRAFAGVPVFPQLAVGFLVVNLLFVYLSGHRSAFISVGAGLAVLVLSKEKRKVSWVKASIAFAVFVALLLIAWKFVAPSVGVLAEKYETILAPTEEANAAWRLEFWIAMIGLWWTAPIAGVGFAYDFINVEPWGVVEEHYDPHNSYLAILARMGVIGLILTIVFLVAVSIMFTKIMRSAASPRKRMLAGCLFSSFISIAVFGSANVTLESPYHAIFLWIFAGLGVALSQTALSEGRR